MSTPFQIFTTLEKYFDSSQDIQERSSDISILVRMKCVDIRWENLSYKEKQVARKEHLNSMLKRENSRHLVEYYENFIRVSNATYELLRKIEIEINDNNEKNITNYELLILFAVLSIEKEYIDKFLFPERHLSPIYFQKLLENKYLQKLKHLDIQKFAESYSIMYTLWKKITP